MKILMLSDIHNNLSAVLKMRGRETNQFDLVVVAGDIGSNRAQEIFDVLASFQCPVAYVYGNWDSKLDYEQSFGDDCNHLHLTPLKAGKLIFTGFSGCTAHWGRNPIAARLRKELNDANQEIISKVEEVENYTRASTASIKAEYTAVIDDLLSIAKLQKSAYKRKLKIIEKERDGKLDAASRNLSEVKETAVYKAYMIQSSNVRGLVQSANRDLLSAVTQSLGPDIARTVVVTHDRLTRTQTDFRGVPLFLFAHRHGFSDTAFQGSRYINVSVLDKGQLVRPLEHKRGDFFNKHRNIHAGNYVILEWTTMGGFVVENKTFEPPEDWAALWEIVPDIEMPMAEFLP
ncbi:metallophosphoesterase family protein [Agrobacterium sp.]|uniref:metallophosphoesterase family protein n=1 Tax=Agrobacterium sp. TaxID=361 RepID=UPI002897B385|nr:metallophosphoesterase family protein [Agrobacterium sp.]